MNPPGRESEIKAIYPDPNRPNPELTQKFEELIKSYAEAKETGKEEDAQMAAFQALT